jgi:chromosome segregation protein
MTIIKRLEARGFKSFANKTELVFGETFNCVVGPNGSGKSNVMDCISFVLGKGSAKGMRAEKSASLIYHGGKKGKPASSAEVSIEFENKDRSFPIQEDAVILTRTVKRDGTSKYKINGELRTRQQFVEFLHAARVDPDGHNIVLQGDIVAFTEMKPISRRELIEEIAGISAYEERKNKCLKELEKVDGRLNETEIILTEREKNLKELRKDRDQAKRYKEVETDLADNKATLIHIQVKAKEEKVEALDKKKSEYTKSIEKVNEDIEKVRGKVAEWEAQIKEINTKFEEEGEREQLIIRKQIDELKEDVVKTSSRLEICGSEVGKIKNRVVQLKQSLTDFDKKIKDINEERKGFKGDLTELDKEEKSVEKQIAGFKSEHGIESNSMQQLEELEKQLDLLADDISDLREKKEEFTRDKDRFGFRVNILNERISNLKGEGDSKEAVELQKDRADHKKTVEEFNRAVAENTSYVNQLSESRRKMYRAEDDLARLRTKQLTIQEFSRGDLAIRKTLELRNNNNGIVGTVGELGKVDSKYSVAINIAAGPRVHSVVVDNDSTARKTIQHLRENKLGVVRFLPMNKLNTRPIDKGVKSLLDKKGVVGLALDLIDFESKYKTVFSYVFGNTLIVEDLETARMIGIGKIRMVTLEGDVVELSGAMVGGYRNKKISGGFKEKQIDDNVTALEVEVKRLRDIIENIEPKKNNNEGIIDRLRREKADLEGNILRLEKALNIDGNLLDSLETERKGIQTEMNDVLNRIKEVVDGIDGKRKEFDDIRTVRNGLKEKLSNPALVRDLEGLENRKLSLREKRITLEGQLKNYEAQIVSMILPEKERTEKIIKQHEKELIDFGNEIKDLTEIVKNRQKELTGKEKEESKFRGLFKDQIEKRNKLIDRVKDKDTEIAIKQEKNRSVENKSNELAIDRARFLAEIEGLRKEGEPYANAKIKRGQNLEDLRARIRELEREMLKIGNVNLRALEVYEEIEREYESILEKVSKLRSEKEDVLGLMNEIEVQKIEVFTNTFRELNKYFKRIFLSLSTKGEAYLELENKESPFEGGVNIRVKLFSGKYMDLKGLSGGEKTMTALAFIFAIQEHDPSPFYLMDEVDAALDKRNSELLSRLIEKYAKEAQYIVISHNDSIITEADQIYGVSMQDGVSKIVSLKI